MLDTHEMMVKWLRRMDIHVFSMVQGQENRYYTANNKCNGKSTVPPIVIKYKERHPSDLRLKLNIHKHISLLFARCGFANTTPLTLANLLFVVYSPYFHPAHMEFNNIRHHSSILQLL